jgi:hypothetical protein
VVDTRILPRVLHAHAREADDLGPPVGTQLGGYGAVSAQEGVYFFAAGVAVLPLSHTKTARRQRPSTIAALSPAGPAPMMTTS